MALGDGVEGTVAQARDAGIVLVGLVAALAQQPVEIGRRWCRGGDLAAEGLGGGAQGLPRSALPVLCRGVREELRREAIVARGNAHRQLAVGALVELRRPPRARTGTPRSSGVGD